MLDLASSGVMRLHHAQRDEALIASAVLSFLKNLASDLAYVQIIYIGR